MTVYAVVFYFYFIAGPIFKVTEKGYPTYSTIEACMEVVETLREAFKMAPPPGVYKFTDGCEKIVIKEKDI